MEITQTQGAWKVRLSWPEGPITGGPQRIVIEPSTEASARDQARGISTTVLRRIDLAAALEAAKEVGAPTPAAPYLHQAETARALLTAEGVSPRYLAALAGTYVVMSDSGARAVIPELAEKIGRRPETVKGHLKQARRDGLLTTIAGKAGGELTARATSLLTDLDDFTSP